MQITIVSTSPNSVKLQFEDGYAIHPKKTLIAIADKSDMISFKLLASRKTIYTAKLSELNPAGGDAQETIDLINDLL